MPMPSLSLSHWPVAGTASHLCEDCGPDEVCNARAPTRRETGEMEFGRLFPEPMERLLSTRLLTLPGGLQLILMILCCGRMIAICKA